jgi:hypothetical protein
MFYLFIYHLTIAPNNVKSCISSSSALSSFARKLGIRSCSTCNTIISHRNHNGNQSDVAFGAPVHASQVLELDAFIVV